jgi:cytochrome P450
LHLVEDFMVVAPASVAPLMAALATASGQADPYPLYRQIRALGPAVTAPDGAMVVCGYAECAALLRSPHLRKNPGPLLVASGHPDWRERPSLRLMYTSLLMLNPPEHTRLRQVVADAFSVRQVNRLRHAIEQIVSTALSDMEGTVDFVSAFAFPLPVAVIAELLGIPAVDRAMFQGLVYDWTQILEILSPLAVDEADRAATTIADYLGDLATERRRRPADDLISALVTSDVDEEDLVSLAALLLAAGFETTTGLLTNSLVALFSHPDQADRLRSGILDVPAAVEELLRYDSPIQIAYGRTAATDVIAGGVELHAGQRVITILGAANRDANVFVVGVVPL